MPRDQFLKKLLVTMHIDIGKLATNLHSAVLEVYLSSHIEYRLFKTSLSNYSLGNSGCRTDADALLPGWPHLAGVHA